MKGKEKKSNNNVLYVGVIVAVILILFVAAAVGLLSPKGPIGPTTTQNPNLTTIAVQNLTTTIVSNLTMAIGPNLASCNGYNYSIPNAYYEVIGSCNWRGGLLNVTFYGGAYNHATFSIIQQNVTTAPFNFTTSVNYCTPKSGVTYVPPGNYKVLFATSSPYSSSCGRATLRLSK